MYWRRGGFETDDTLAAVLPLMRQTAKAHEAGRIAPLRGAADLVVDADGRITFDDAKIAGGVMGGVAGGIAQPAQRHRSDQAQSTSELDHDPMSHLAPNARRQPSGLYR